jgi:hypothetical protein
MPKRGYLSKNAYYWQYQYLAVRDGEKCAICGRTPPTFKLDVEHLDTNTFNRDPSNLRLLCRVCNLAVRKMSIKDKAKLCLKDSRQMMCVCDRDGKSMRKGDSVDVYKRAIASGSVDADATVTLSILMQDALKSWLLSWLKQYGFITYHDAKYAGANEARCSVVTAERWIKTWAADNGEIEIVDDAGQRIILLRENKAPITLPPPAAPNPRPRGEDGRFIKNNKE